MATYWKSQPKKHCDFCKCWIADNRPSIDFHERGKRHQENVEKKISELRKKGLEQYKMQKTLDSDLKKMEEDALRAFKKDLASDSTLAAEYKTKAAAAAATAATAARHKEERLKAARVIHRQGLAIKAQQPETATNSIADHQPTSVSSQLPPCTGSVAATEATPTTEAEPTDGVTLPVQCVWLEGTSPEGDTYYWNSETGESLWEKPAEYVATEESTMYRQQGVVVDNGQDELKQEEEPTDGSTASIEKELVPPENEDHEPEVSPLLSRDSSSSEDSEEERTSEVTERPTKRTTTNPYGGWNTVIPDNTSPVDLQLPQSDRPHFQPIIPKAAQHQPRERMKFKERVVSSLPASSSSKSGSGETSFKKRKFGGGGRSIRQRDNDT